MQNAWIASTTRAIDGASMHSVQSKKHDQKVIEVEDPETRKLKRNSSILSVAFMSFRVLFYAALAIAGLFIIWAIYNSHMSLAMKLTFGSLTGFIFFVWPLGRLILRKVVESGRLDLTVRGLKKSIGIDLFKRNAKLDQLSKYLEQFNICEKLRNELMTNSTMLKLVGLMIAASEDETRSNWSKMGKYYILYIGRQMVEDGKMKKREFDEEVERMGPMNSEATIKA